MFRFMSVLLLLFFMASCTKTYKLSSDDIKWNPYQGDEILVFQNSHGDTDTIFVKNVVKTKTVDDNLALFPNYHESLDVIVRHSDPTSSNEHRYIENSFFEIYREDGRNTYISFHLNAKRASFYSSSSYSKSNLEEVPSINCVIKDITYNDVIKIESLSKEYNTRDEFIATVYWSKSNGYVRYDLNNGIYWELVKKYSFR